MTDNSPFPIPTTVPAGPVVVPPGLAAALLVAAAFLGMTTGLLASHALARARSPAPVPVRPVAVGTAVLWALIAGRWLSGAFSTSWLPVPLVLAAVAVPLAAADFRHRRLPDVLTLPAYPLLAVSLAVATAASPGMAVRAFGGAVVFGGLHLLVHALSRRSLGAGDVKLAAPLGAVLAAVHWGALVAAAMLAAVVTVVLSVTRRWRHGVPHGPGLLFATCLVALFPATDGQVSMGT